MAPDKQISDDKDNFSGKASINDQENIVVPEMGSVRDRAKILQEKLIKDTDLLHDPAAENKKKIQDELDQINQRKMALFAKVQDDSSSSLPSPPPSIEHEQLLMSLVEDFVKNDTANTEELLTKISVPTDSFHSADEIMSIIKSNVDYTSDEDFIVRDKNNLIITEHILDETFDNVDNEPEKTSLLEERKSKKTKTNFNFKSIFKKKSFLNLSRKSSTAALNTTTNTTNTTNTSASKKSRSTRKRVSNCPSFSPAPGNNFFSMTDHVKKNSDAEVQNFSFASDAFGSIENVSTPISNRGRTVDLAAKQNIKKYLAKAAICLENIRQTSLGIQTALFKNSSEDSASSATHLNSFNVMEAEKFLMLCHLKKDLYIQKAYSFKNATPSNVPNRNVKVWLALNNLRVSVADEFTRDLKLAQKKYNKIYFCAVIVLNGEEVYPTESCSIYNMEGKEHVLRLNFSSRNMNSVLSKDNLSIDSTVEILIYRYVCMYNKNRMSRVRQSFRRGVKKVFGGDPKKSKKDEKSSLLDEDLLSCVDTSEMPGAVDLLSINSKKTYSTSSLDKAGAKKILTIKDSEFKLHSKCVFRLADCWTGQMGFSKSLYKIEQQDALRCELSFEEGSERLIKPTVEFDFFGKPDLQGYKKGYLTLFSFASGLPKWTRYWCALKDDNLLLYNYEEGNDEQSKTNKVFCFTLMWNTAREIRALPMYVCSRPRSFEISIRYREQDESKLIAFLGVDDKACQKKSEDDPWNDGEDGSAGAILEKSERTARLWFSADSGNEMKEWMDAFLLNLANYKSWRSAVEQARGAVLKQ